MNYGESENMGCESTTIVGQRNIECTGERRRKGVVAIGSEVTSDTSEGPETDLRLDANRWFVEACVEYV